MFGCRCFKASIKSVEKFDTYMKKMKYIEWIKAIFIMILICYEAVEFFDISVDFFNMVFHFQIISVTDQSLKNFPDTHNEAALATNSISSGGEMRPLNSPKCGPVGRTISVAARLAVRI